MICKTFSTFILWPLSKFLLIIKYSKRRPDLKTTFIHHWPIRMFCLVPKQWQIIYLRWTQNFLKKFYFWPLIEGGKKCKLFGRFSVHTKWMIPNTHWQYMSFNYPSHHSFFVVGTEVLCCIYSSVLVHFRYFYETVLEFLDYQCLLNYFFIIHFTKFWGNNEFTCSKI